MRGRKSDAVKRLEAYRRYAEGAKKVEIARELEVSKQLINHWSKADRWEERIQGASMAADLITDNALANALADLRRKASTRIRELEVLCLEDDPRVRLAAIQAWLRLAGIEKLAGLPPTTNRPAGLTLVDDISEEKDDAGRAG